MPSWSCRSFLYVDGEQSHIETTVRGNSRIDIGGVGEILDCPILIRVPLPLYLSFLAAFGNAKTRLNDNSSRFVSLWGALQRRLFVGGGGSAAQSPQSQFLSLFHFRGNTWRYPSTSKETLTAALSIAVSARYHSTFVTIIINFLSPFLLSFIPSLPRRRQFFWKR